MNSVETKTETKTGTENIIVPSGVFEKENQLMVRLEDVAILRQDLKFQNYIEAPPVSKAALYGRACTSDSVTIDSWASQWLNQIKENAKHFDFKKMSIIKEHGKHALKPCIIAGSGSSLKINYKELKDKGDIPLISCLHNFGLFEDAGIKVDYYLNLDAGDITIPEMTEAGKQDQEFYWERTKNLKLATTILGNPALLKKWRGEILFFNTIAPDPVFLKDLTDITDFNLVFNTGGNALGACLYMAKAILGCNPICFVGADFSFGYNKKFHAWDSNYDNQFTGLMPATDVFGNRVWTWASYFNFKCWFDYIALGGKGNNPGTYINCTEGGIFGAYPDGNIRAVTQMSLHQFLCEYNLYKILPDLLKDKKQYN